MNPQTPFLSDAETAALVDEIDALLNAWVDLSSQSVSLTRYTTPDIQI